MRKIKIYCLAILLASYISPMFVSAEVTDNYKVDETVVEHRDNSVENNLEKSTSSETIFQESDETNSSEEMSNLSVELKNEKSLKATVTSGIFGTSKWQINSAGDLHISSGEFIDTSNNSPWFSYRDQIKRIIFDGPVKASSNSSSLFSHLDKVVEFEHLNELDTSNVTIMRDMFSNTSSLISLDLSNFDTSKVIDMGFMFANASNLVSLNIFNFNTSNVVYMRSMFYGTTNLNDLDISNFDTSYVEDMSGLFMNSGVKNLELSYFFTNSTKDMSGMFSGVDLDTLNLSHFDTSKVRNMAAMFSWSKINHLNVSNLDTSKVVDMEEMFTGSQIRKVDLSSFDTANVANMNNMFSGSQLDSIDISNFDTNQVIYMYDMFARMNNLKHINLGINFQFKDGIMLPSPSSSRPYYGKWQREHEGAVYTSDELAQQYDGLTMSGNYYWAEKNPTLEVKDSIIYEGEEWNPRDNFVSAADEDGNPLSFDPSMTFDRVNTDVPGLYEVTYKNGAITKTITVTVKENKESIHAKDSIIYVGDSWEGVDNFVSATDKDGNELAFTNTMLNGIIDTKTPGKYSVTYVNGEATQTVTISVKENKENIQAHNSTIKVGDVWNAKDNFQGATDKEGLPVNFEEIIVTGNVDTSKVGKYEIKYTYGNVSVKVEVQVEEVIDKKSKKNHHDSNKENVLNITEASKKNNSINKAHQVIPKTGERVNLLFIVFGVFLSIISVVFLTLQKKTL